MKQSSTLLTRALFSLTCAVMVLTGTALVPLNGSSGIIDAVIVKVTEKKSKQTITDENGVKKKVTNTTLMVHFRGVNSPYTSVGAHSRVLSTADGRPSGITVKPVDIFESYYIDDVPVSMEDIIPLLKPGVRITTMDNRSWQYYLRVASRSSDNKLGFMTGLEEKEGQATLTLSRPQLPSVKGGFFPPGEKSLEQGARIMEDGYIHLHPGFYPPVKSEIMLAPDAVVVIGAERKPLQEFDLSPWVKAMPEMEFKDIQLPPIEEISKLGLEGRDRLTAMNQEVYKRAGELFADRPPVLIQAAREHMRVEIIEPGHGRWDLVNGREFNRWGKQMQGMFAGIMLSDGRLEKKSLCITRYTQREEPFKYDEVPAFKALLLGGGRPQDGEKPGTIIYRSLHGQVSRPDYIIDGMYSVKGDCHWGAITPGQWMVAHMRRSRPFADFIHIESENPVCWGTITTIDDGSEPSGPLTITVDAPEIPGVTPSGAQSFQIPQTAEYYRFGQILDKKEQSELFKKGALIRVYPARPQTILIDHTQIKSVK